jgi:type IV pilus assembly protein PilP
VTAPRLVLAAVLVALVALAACGGKPKPAAAPAKPAGAAAPVAAAPASAEASAEAKKPGEGEWSYSSAGKRDPFRSFLAEARASGKLLDTRCATPLGRFELEQLKLVAVVTGLEDPVAMVQAPSGVGYAVRRGACIGKNGGTVLAVRTGEVVVAEWVIRADGTRDRTQTVLSLPKREPLNLEE